MDTSKYPRRRAAVAAAHLPLLAYLRRVLLCRCHRDRLRHCRAPSPPEDTLRNFRSRSSVGGGAGLEDRPKLLGFVGVQTGFGSADRQAALRSTWFPSDPEALARFFHRRSLMVFLIYYVI
ncbi:probable beta-1,3-galactosyltransferase 14 [Dioscorea cayenensis subsp. rotundata]|uniref:Probable beta-1,3-galactosyltransferase 14 n=1 Tax=Dioscorea cayennensis subsp. rotundata TaxID=55577 RepID=A0AB40CY99_DIOCR|nr:probable beta-1,3-galactosyltransferase 14 [Dioscorea cayenensis subsp. rotundata]XP_039144984.1 probable beta-1,3-galactosyltransferase 14 [Dioscorea cayenensis subsp. rotundata]